MEKVAEFINVKSYRQALARLCRLAGSSTSDGRRVLDDWERCYKRSVHAINRAMVCMVRDDAPLISGDEVGNDPLLWLQALDEHCHRDISCQGYFCNIRLDDGDV